MLKKIIFYSLISVLFTFASCAKDEVQDYSKFSGESVNFGVGMSTRTSYQYADSHQIIWESDDKIRIYSHEAKTAVKAGTAETAIYADYTVTPQSSDATYGVIGSEGTTNPLLWGDLVEGARPVHTFYAVFPANNNVTVKNGIATFPINRNQKCEVYKSSHDNDKVYTYVAKPDMDNAYMVARSESNPTTGEVWLDFKPIMTTLNIVVNGPQNLTEDTDKDGVADAPGDPSTDNYEKASSVLVTGVSIISTLNTNVNTLDSFNYDFSSSDQKNWSIAGSGGTGDVSEKTETTFISLINKIDDETTNENYGASAVVLNEGETISVTAFLPPMTVEAMKNSNRNVEIRVHTTGGNKTLSLAEATLQLTPSDKGKIKLPNMFTPIENSAWMTPLDDDIYVSQLSIPGTHDAATSGCEVSAGKCQGLSIADQLEMGIRFFDLRPSALDSTMPIYHGEAPANTNMEAVWDTFNEFLDDNPGEFIITLVRWEEEAGGLGVIIKNDSYSDFMTYMASFVKSDRFKKYALPTANIKADVTIGEMRPEGTFTVDGKNVTRKQGRILTMVRPMQGVKVVESSSGVYSFTTNDKVNWGTIFSPDYHSSEGVDCYYNGYDTTNLTPDGIVLYTNFPGSHPGTEQSYLKRKFINYGSSAVGGNGLGQWGALATSTAASGWSKDWIVYCQNYYELSSSSDIATKLTYVKNYISKSVTNAATANNFVWTINHASGYVSSALDPDAYAQVGAGVNIELYNYINAMETPGSLGIILLDFVGQRDWNDSGWFDDDHTLYGDLLPQTIIDNNYKYRMKRKGE